MSKSLCYPGTKNLNSMDLKTDPPHNETAPGQVTPPDSNPQPATSDNPAHRRNGKVARLPKELRELVNVMLSDGTPYPAIIQKIAERGHALNPDNLSR